MKKIAIYGKGGTLKSENRTSLPKLNTSTYYGRASSVSTDNSQAINYTKFIITIIEVLSKISDNTAKLDKVIDLLKLNSGRLGIDTSGLGKGASNSEKVNSIKSALRNSNSGGSGWEMAAIKDNNSNSSSDAFMSSILALVRE